MVSDIDHLSFFDVFKMQIVGILSQISTWVSIPKSLASGSSALPEVRAHGSETSSKLGRVCGVESVDPGLKGMITLWPIRNQHRAPWPTRITGAEVFLVDINVDEFLIRKFVWKREQVSYPPDLDTVIPDFPSPRWERLMCIPVGKLALGSTAIPRESGTPRVSGS